MRPLGYSALLALLLAACGGSTAPEKPTLQVTPQSLDITEGYDPVSMVLTTRPAGASVRWWVASKATWLHLSSDSGTVNGTTTLTATVVTPSTQEPGAITSQLVLGSSSGTVTVNVNATVPRSPRIAIMPASLAIPAGSDTGEVTLTNTGHGGGSWRASSSVPWLTFPVLEGFLEVRQSVVLKVVVHRASLPPGTSNGSIGILSGTDVVPVQIPVTVTVPTP